MAVAQSATTVIDKIGFMIQSPTASVFPHIALKSSPYAKLEAIQITCAVAQRADPLTQ
jgi:hypothetical protein